MKRIYNLAILLFIFPQMVYTAENKYLPYEKGVIEISIPDGFKSEQKTINASGALGLLLTSAEGSQIKAEIIASAVDDSMLSYLTKEEIAKTNLRTTAEFYRQYAVETEFKLDKISRNGFDAFSCELTDKRNIMPKGEFRCITIISAVKENAMIISVVHYNDKGNENIRKAIDAILTCNIKKNSNTDK